MYILLHGIHFYFSPREILKNNDIHGLKIQCYKDISNPQNDL